MFSAVEQSSLLSAEGLQRLSVHFVPSSDSYCFIGQLLEAMCDLVFK